MSENNGLVDGDGVWCRNMSGLLIFIMLGVTGFFLFRCQRCKLQGTEHPRNCSTYSGAFNGETGLSCEQDEMGVRRSYPRTYLSSSAVMNAPEFVENWYIAFYNHRDYNPGPISCNVCKQSRPHRQ